MSTSKEYLNFILDQMSLIDGVTYKQMMGEYIVYIGGKIAAYLCDNRLLVKPVLNAIKMLPNAKYEPPYEGAKDMILVENVDDKEFLKQLFEAIYSQLSEPKKRRRK